MCLKPLIWSGWTASSFSCINWAIGAGPGIYFIDFILISCCVKVQGQISCWYMLGCQIHQGGEMSLVKYTVFMNFLTLQLGDSGRSPTCSIPKRISDDLTMFS